MTKAKDILIPLIVVVAPVALVIFLLVSILLSSDRPPRPECAEVKYNTNLNCFKIMSNYKE